jgi:hypothetical protein
MNLFLILFIIGFAIITNPLDTTNNKLIGLSSVFGEEILGLLSTSTDQIVRNSGIAPTFNPPLLSCNPGAKDTAGGFDLAEYVITGDFDKDKLRGEDNTFQVFADLVKDDGAEIEGKDAPYKMNVLTDDGDKKVKAGINEIATICTDIQKVKNIDKETEIDLDKSPLFKSMNY